MSKETMPQGFDRYLSPIDVWAMAFGCMIGWGAFVMPGTTFLPIAGPMGTVIAIAIGAVVMLIVGMSVSYLMKRSPRTGGMYSYAKEAFGRDHAFLCAWFLSLSYLTVVFLNGSALFVVIRTIFGSNIQTGLHYMIAGNEVYLQEIGMSALALIAVGMLFIFAKPFLQRLLTVLAIILLVGAVATTVICMQHAPSMDAICSFGTQGVNNGFAIFSLIILAPWAFVGFEIVTFETSHFKFPVAKVGRIIVASILIAAFVYIAMTLVSVTTQPDGYSSWTAYIANLGNLSGAESVPTFYAAKANLGDAGLVIIGVTALAAILTGIIGAYRAMVRVLSTMAEDKILADMFSKTTISILFVMALSVVISLLGRNTLVWFVDLTSFGAIVAYGYTCAAAHRIARSEGNRKIMAVGLLGTIIAVVFVIVQLVPHLAALDAMGSEAFLLLSLWCLLGFVFYWRTIVRSTLTEFSGMSISGTVLFALLIYSAFMWLAKLIARMDNMDDVRAALVGGGVVLLLIIFFGLVIMLYIQRVMQEKHEVAERERIRAMEGSLAKSQFLFNMSHDIRTPMNAIIGYTNLARNAGSVEAVQEYLDKIDMSSGQLLALINDILEMSRIESGKVERHYEPADLRAIIDEIGDLFTEQMRQKNLEFSVHTSQMTDNLVWCDKRNLNRVLLNLVSNAYKFTPEGGSVSITLWQTDAAIEGYGSYEMSVEDTGIGMSREFVDKMFTAFERERTSTDSGIEGTGLGLAITKSLVDLMGGTIEVLTSPGGGTKIIIGLKLKIAQEDDVPKAKDVLASDADSEINFSEKRLLLVEDNAINMEIAKMILDQQGFMVEEAENGQVAVDMVSQSEPGYYDAILMDVQMPVMNGYEATRAIRALDDKALASIPILAMTANAFQEDVQAAKDAGMQAHIAKPIDVAVLVEELAAVLK